MGSARATKKAAKAARRARGKSGDRRRNDLDLRLTPVGGPMDPDVFDAVLAAIRQVDLDAPWASMAPMILPVVKRVHHPYPPEATPLHIHVPPGIWTGFGIDVGPAFSHVTARMLEHWEVDTATLLATALDNLRRLVVDQPPHVQSFAFEGMELVGIQGQGWGSSLLLLPEALRPILGPEPRLLLAPVRNTIIAMPEHVDADLAVGVWEAVAHGAHDELEVDPMRWTGASVVALADGARGLPN
jgi:hypothetical protein